jgi:hypothetical protein
MVVVCLILKEIKELKRSLWAHTDVVLAEGHVLSI